MIEIKIDRDTLPKDKQQVRWQTHSDVNKGIWKEGIFSSGDDLFCEGLNKWNSSFDVLHWEVLETKKQFQYTCCNKHIFTYKDSEVQIPLLALERQMSKIPEDMPAKRWRVTRKWLANLLNRYACQ